MTSAGAEADPVTRTDQVPSFVAFWGKTLDRPPDEIAVGWETTYVGQLPEMVRVSLQRHRFPDDVARAIPRMASLIDDLLPRRDLVHAVAGGAVRRLADLLATEIEPFELVTLVGAFSADAWVEWQDRQATLLIAVEALESSAQANVLVRHEIAHVLHLQSMADADIWDVGDALFEEGLATALSGVGTDHGDGTLCAAGRTTTWQGEPVDAWATRCQASWPAIRVRLQATFSSEDQEAYEALFLGGTKAPDLPPRSGYYAGLRLVRELARSASWPEIVRWDRETARFRILESLMGEES